MVTASMTRWRTFFAATAVAVIAACFGIGAADSIAAMSKTLDVGTQHTCAVKTTGAVVCWGLNDSGAVGDGSTTERHTPVPVSGLISGVKAVAVGGFHSCALLRTGAVKCWGFNATGQVGDGTTDDRLAPVDVVGLSSSVAAIEAGFDHTCALMTTGSVKCWGRNDKGQLGDGTFEERHMPVDVPDLYPMVVSIATATDHTCAVLSTGTAKCWGFNGNFALANGSAMNLPVPTQIAGLDSGVVDITGGNPQTCAIHAAGNIKCWGRNLEGSLGTGNYDNSGVPQAVVGIGSATSVTAGGAHTCALLATTGVACWGDNTYGQLGINSAVAKHHTPTGVYQLSSGVASVTNGEFANHTCAVMTTGAARCWGQNSSGQLGDDTIISKDQHVAVHDLIDVAQPEPVMIAPLVSGKPIMPIFPPAQPTASPIPTPRILRSPRSSKISGRIRFNLYCPVGCELNLKLKIGRTTHTLRAIKVRPTQNRRVAVRIPSKLRKAGRKALRRNRRTKMKLYAQPIAATQAAKTKTIKTSIRRKLAKRSRVNVHCQSECEAWPSLKIGRTTFVLRPIKLNTASRRVAIRIPSKIRRVATKARKRNRRTGIRLQVRTVERVQRGGTVKVRLK